MSSFGISGSSSSFSTDISQIDNLLSSLATAITDSSLGWKAIEVMGSVCQLKHKSYSLLFFLHILKSHTFTNASSPPVTIKCLAIWFQSATLTSLSCALIFSWDFFVSLTLISTIWSVPSEEPEINKKFTWSEDKILVWWVNNIFNRRCMIMVSSQCAPSCIIFVICQDGDLTLFITYCELSDLVRVPVESESWLFEGDDDLLYLFRFFWCDVIFKFLKVSGQVHEMNFASFDSSVAPECNNWRAIKWSDSVDIIGGYSLLIEQFWIIINILFFFNSFWIIVISCPVKFGPFVEVNIIIFGVVATALNGVDFVGIFGHDFKSGEWFERRCFINKVNWQWWPLNVESV